MNYTLVSLDISSWLLLSTGPQFLAVYTSKANHMPGLVITITTCVLIPTRKLMVWSLLVTQIKTH